MIEGLDVMLLRVTIFGNGGNCENDFVNACTGEIFFENTDRAEPITPLENGLVLSGEDFAQTNLSIRLSQLEERFESVNFQLDGPISHKQTEKLPPFTLFGDQGEGNLNGRTFPMGNYQLFVQKNGKEGVESEARVYRFTITNPELRISQVNLINAESDAVIQTLNDGDRLDRSQLGNINLSIQALSGDNFVGSVQFQLSGPISRSQTESQAPYALFGDQNESDFLGQFFPDGNYTLTTTPYSRPGAEGRAGPTLTLNFEVFTSPSNLLLGANPNDGAFRVTVPGAGTLMMYDRLGELIWQKTYPQSRIEDFQLNAPHKGLFLLRFQSLGGDIFREQKVMIR
ncbi:MAG: hypothetical protein AAFU64_11745 [Bacteroidota bacterium]